MQAQHAREAIVVGSRGMHDARRFLLGSVPPSCLTRPAVSAPSGRELARLGAVVTDATTWQSTMRLASMRAVSDKPFGEALRILMSERDLTYRSLAEATRSLDGKGMTHAHLNMLANGHDKPSIRAMELIARACDVKPEHFAEYRLAAAMRELDPAEVGLERALANLSARLGDRRRSDARERPAQRPQARPHPSG